MVTKPRTYHVCLVGDIIVLDVIWVGMEIKSHRTKMYTLFLCIDQFIYPNQTCPPQSGWEYESEDFHFNSFPLPIKFDVIIKII